MGLFSFICSECNKQIEYSSCQKEHFTKIKSKIDLRQGQND